MRAVEGRHRHARDFRQAQIFRRRLLRPVDQLLAVDDLQEAALVGAVAEIDAVALRSGRDRAVQFGRHRAGRARLLAGQAEIADLDGMGGIAEIVDLRHAARAPVRRARHQKGDAGVAFPQALVRVLQAADPRDQHRIGGIGNVPDLMRFAAESAQHVDRVAIALRQRLAVADAHHLRAAGFVFAFLPGNVAQIFGLRGIGDIDDRGAVRLGLAGLRIDRRRERRRCRRDGRYRRSSGRPDDGWSADRRCAPADRCCRPASCWRLRAAHRLPAAARKRYRHMRTMKSKSILPV